MSRNNFSVYFPYFKYKYNIIDRITLSNRHINNTSMQQFFQLLLAARIFLQIMLTPWKIVTRLLTHWEGKKVDVSKKYGDEEAALYLSGSGWNILLRGKEDRRKIHSSIRV